MKASIGKTDSPKATSIPRQAASATPSIPAPHIPATLIESSELHNWQLVTEAGGDLKELPPELSGWIMIQGLVYSNTGMTQIIIYIYFLNHGGRFQPLKDLSERQRQGETFAEVSPLISAFPSTCLLSRPHRVKW